MTHYAVSAIIEAPVQVVWDALSDIESHADWTEDVTSIKHVSGPKDAVGGKFQIFVKYGPIRATDNVEIVEWSQPSVMALHHNAGPHGIGRVTLTKAGKDSQATQIDWTEDLTFPWYMVGPIGGFVAGNTIMKYMLHRSVQALKAHVESQTD